MITARLSKDRGHADHGWLQTRHTFSFGAYHDPMHLGFRALRVINEDLVQPARGFSTHPHRDMEILTYVVSGAIEHKDSLGNGSIIRPGEVQRMTAGTGVTHSEFNPLDDQLLHLLQIWIVPERLGLQPGYEQRAFAADARGDAWCIVASRDGRDGSLVLHQDVALYTSLLTAGMGLRHEFTTGRHGWLQVVGGSVALGGERLDAGDGAAISDETSIELRATEDAELLFFDLA
ncbi:MAG: pirin family protein [Proteobacteria bacterium]|nr:pirin family protein [Pseudomonadota bacterium]